MYYPQGKIWLAMADACFDGSGMSVLEQFQWAKNHDCLSIEAGESGVNNPQAYAVAMAETGLFVHGVNVWLAGEDYFLKAINAAKILGASYITHQVPSQANRQQGLKCIEHYQQICRDAGLNYLVETHRWTATEKLDDTEYYLEKIPDLDVLSDISHYIPLLYNTEAFKFLHPKTKAIHIRVAMANNVQVEIGTDKNHQGCQLFKQIWSDILLAGFSGPVVGEIIPFYLTYPRYNATEDNANGLALFRETLSDLGLHNKLLLPSTSKNNKNRLPNV